MVLFFVKGWAVGLVLGDADPAVTPARSMASSRAVLVAALWRWFSASTAEKSRSVALVVRALS